jgi:hypothetical protein
MVCYCRSMKELSDARIPANEQFDYCFAFGHLMERSGKWRISSIVAIVF